MNKNLKKVISAVAALAMSASTLVAFAANYPDVDASASYKQAVDELSALNIINGYDDGTFQPDKLVSRAEFAKMVITTLGNAELAQAEAAANTNTAFPDVKGDHWAAGFVTAATANKIINGFDDGTFKPDANITYAQAMKMLVCAAGYEQWSTDKGGWPTGYMYYGNQLGVGKGVKDVVQDTEITRAQCAQMIDNVLNAPVCVETNEMSYDIYGNQYPKLEQKDGTGVDFQSILTKKHDVYKVKGMVTGTHKSGESSKTDEVSFKIMSAKNWNDEEDQISKKNQNQDVIPALIGDSEADKFLHQYVEALIAVDEDDEYTILSLSVTGQNDDVTIAAADYDEDYVEATDFVDTKMYVLKNGKSSSYKIDEAAEMYVNGVSVGDYTSTNVKNYIKDNTVGNITLIDTPGDTNVTDGKYDYIMVEYYLTGVVDSVIAADEENIEISFLDSDDAVSSELNPWSIDLSDEDVVYSFELDGENFDVTDLAQFDVLSIQANPTELGDSRFYDVKVSKNVVDGKVSSYDSEDKVYTVNGTEYQTTAQVEGLIAGDSYTMYLDVFGRIAYTDELASDKKIAILDSAYEEASGDSKAKLILPDGTTAEYILKDKDNNIATAIAAVWTTDAQGNRVKKNVEDRVVEYSISNNELVIKKVYEDPKGEADLEYKANQNRIGKYMISEEATAFIYAGSNNKSTDITAMDMSTLVDGNLYEAYFYDISTSSSVYRFVIVKTGAGQLTADSGMAIVKKSIEMTDESKGETVGALVLVIDGEEKTVMAEDGFEVSGYSEGDAILYGTNAEGYIDNIVVLTKNFDLSAGYAELFEAAMKKDADLTNDEKDEFKAIPATKNGEISIAFGPIIEKTTNSITLGELVEGKDGLVSDRTEGALSYSSKVNFYTYNYNSAAKSRVAVLNSGAVSPITIPNGAYLDKTERAEFYWNELSETTNPRFALVKMVDDEVTDVYVIIPKTGTKIDKSSL